MRNIFKRRISDEKGVILTGVLVFSFISVVIITGVTSWFTVVYKSNRNLIVKEQAFHIAEAGIEYYRWHLAHDPDDFQDGTGGPGPYVHDVLDKDGVLIGSFSLEIETPGFGTKYVVLESTGTALSNPDVARTIRVELAIPSFAKYAFVSDDNIRFQTGTVVNGPIHSNGGVRFDGVAYNVVSSAKDTYDDPDHNGSYELGVHTHANPTDPLPPSEREYVQSVPDRYDIFVAGREFPVPSVDFTGIASDIANYQTLSQEDGVYYGSSGVYGYLVQLKTDNTFDLYKVDTLADVPDWSCQNFEEQEGWSTWSVGDTTFVDNFDMPSNGIMFFEDNIWVEGKIEGARLNIVAAEFPDITSNRKSITVNNDLEYTYYDGTDVIGLIAQKDINVGLYSEDDLHIDAAMIAQNGRVGRYYYTPTWHYKGNQYPTGCEPYSVRDTITINGMVASRLRFGFAYTDGTGYLNRLVNYDPKLLYAPPPSFPLTSDTYEILSWEEIE